MTSSPLSIARSNQQRFYRTITCVREFHIWVFTWELKRKKNLFSVICPVLFLPSTKPLYDSHLVCSRYEYQCLRHNYLTQPWTLAPLCWLGESNDSVPHLLLAHIETLLQIMVISVPGSVLWYADLVGMITASGGWAERSMDDIHSPVGAGQPVAQDHDLVRWLANSVGKH